jgi:SAM-dependent methyltransferase
MSSEAQDQTGQAFGYKWSRRDTFESKEFLEAQREFLLRRYGDVANAPWWSGYDRPRILDVGCGAGMTAGLLFGERLKTSDYLGVDISTAYEVARTRFAELGLPGRFEQGDMCKLPYPPESFDVILAEGVLHHTDDTEHAFRQVARHLKRGGRFLGYVYRRKGPIREFTDDYVRQQIAGMAPEQAWEALKPLTRLGKTLAELDVEIDIPEPIDILGVPAGKINLQRFFYWHVLKAYHRPEWSDDENHHVNFDWFAPKNAHRHTQEEIERWCADCGLVIERLDTGELAGYAFIARRP